MLLFIVPTFRDLFADLGGTLPLPTRIVVFDQRGLPKFLAPILLVLGIVGGPCCGRSSGTTARVREVVDPLKLKVPVFGKLFRKVYLARTTRNLSSMLGAGVPMLQAIDVVSATTGSVVVSRALDRVRDAVRDRRGPRRADGAGEDLPADDRADDRGGRGLRARSTRCWPRSPTSTTRRSRRPPSR